MTAVAGVVTVGVLTALKAFTKVHERDMSDALTGPGGKDSSNLTDILKAGMRTAAAIEAGVILGIDLNVEVKEDADLKEVVRLEADLEVEV